MASIYLEIEVEVKGNHVPDEPEVGFHGGYEDIEFTDVRLLGGSSPGKWLGSQGLTGVLSDAIANLCEAEICEAIDGERWERDL